jgi:hypothetical protein
MTLEEWKAKGAELFGEDYMKWKFLCPMCHHVISTQDYKDAGAKESAVAFNCLGRYRNDAKPAIFTKDLKGNGPCNYTGGGLFNFNPLELEIDGKSHFLFDFA